MTHHIVNFLRSALVHYGYWAVVATLLLENAGLPLPGETALLLSSFLAYSERDLRLGWIVVAGTIASATGSSFGYALGCYGGRPLLERAQFAFQIKNTSIARAEKLFESYGEVTILFSRFVFGMRVLAGPMAGMLRMSWKEFAIFNILGAVLWVGVVSCIGYFFSSRWNLLVSFMKRFDQALVAAFVLTVFVFWWRSRRLRRNQSAGKDQVA
jgi:membrane protein DedA with SNARE-associated domain